VEYSDFTKLSSSEKEGLVVAQAGKRLLGFASYVGNIYQLPLFDYVLASTGGVKAAGVALTEAETLAQVVAGSFFNDREAKVLYVWMSDSSNPNASFVHATIRFFFSQGGRHLPNDLGTGFDVHWLPLLRGTSDFGSELDNQALLGTAIEGQGSVQFINDMSFWSDKYDKLYFENQECSVYSWSPLVPIAEAKLLFRGKIQSKSWSLESISFQIKDIFNELRAKVTVADLSDYVGARIPDSQKQYKQRRLYGYVKGHRPANIDQIVTGFPLTGTITLATGAVAVTGVGTTFLKELSIRDEVRFGTDTRKYSVATITSDTAFTISTAYIGPDKAGDTFELTRASNPKRYINRQFLVAGHQLKEPSTTVTGVIRPDVILVADTSELVAGDVVLVDGEEIVIRSVTTTTLHFETNLSSLPDSGDLVIRPAIDSVYINDRLLTRTRDYTYSAAQATITLDELAEFNVAPSIPVKGTVNFTNASRSVTGTGTQFNSDVKVGGWIAADGQGEFFEILSIQDDLNLTLRVPATYTTTSAGKQRDVVVYDEGRTVLSCNSLGSTVDGLTTGVFVKTAPQMVSHLLTIAGLGGSLEASSFTDSSPLVPQQLGLAIPGSVSEKKAPVYRDVITAINRSVFGSLVLSDNFEIRYALLTPEKPDMAARLLEADTLAFTVESASDKIVSLVRINYNNREYEVTGGDKAFDTAIYTSDSATYLAETEKEFNLDTYLVNQTDAEIYSSRWALIYETAFNSVRIDTALQVSSVAVNDRVKFRHEKLFERIGSNQTERVFSVLGIKRNLTRAKIELDDLANTFARCAAITVDTANDFADSADSELLVNGFITDSFGMIANDQETAGTNLIW